jgi:glucan 1,3-beta-glucosidase
MPYNVIEAFDQPWKRAQEGTTGGYWGIYDVHARPKFSMQGPVTEEPRWWLGWLAGAAGVALFVLAGVPRRGWLGLSGWGVLALAGFATGTALAWQYRQMLYACRDLLEWGWSWAACAGGLATAIVLARWLAARIGGAVSAILPGAWLRFAWLFLLALEGLLLVFDGRYRDFPLGLAVLPCIGYGLAGWLSGWAQATGLRLEERCLAVLVPVLAAVVVAQDLGLNPVTWLWLGLNLAIALPVLVAWRRKPVGLPANQA